MYHALDDSASRADGYLALFRHFSVPALSLIFATLAFGVVCGLVALVGSAAYSAWSWRTRKRRGGAVLTVEGDALTIEGLGRRAIHERFALSELVDVALDIKTIERVLEGGSPIPAMRFTDTTVGPKVDTARIVLVSQDGRELPLTTQYLPHMHATEWLGKIRTFLRKHGWVPEDERGDEV